MPEAPPVTRPGTTPEAVRARVCGTKVRHPDIGAARRHARRLNSDHPNARFAPYRCPFCRSWHAGHVPGLESLQELALVIRGLPLTPPQPHDPPARARRRRPKKEKPMPTDTRVVYGARCTWWGLITETSKTGSGLPCCPHCRGVLFEIASEAEWWSGVDQAEAGGRAGYRALIEWAHGRCFPSFDDLEAAYAAAHLEAGPPCNCTPEGCNGEGYEPNDPRTCQLCLHLDAEADCPRDFAEVLVPTLEDLLDRIRSAGFEPHVIAVDGSEPFASLQLDGGYWLDLTAQVREGA
jgi:hypothetical protein